MIERTYLVKIGKSLFLLGYKVSYTITKRTVLYVSIELGN